MTNTRTRGRIFSCPRVSVVQTPWVDFQIKEIEWSPDLSNLQGKRKLFRKIGWFE